MDNAMPGRLRLYCPTGKTFRARRNDAMQGFQSNCQCKNGAKCWYYTNHVTLGCSGGILGAYLDWRMNAKVCICISVNINHPIWHKGSYKGFSFNKTVINTDLLLVNVRRKSEIILLECNPFQVSLEYNPDILLYCRQLVLYTISAMGQTEPRRNVILSSTITS